MNLINIEKLQYALELQKKEHKRLGQILIEQGYITEEQLLDALSLQFDMPKVDLSNIPIYPDIFKIVSETIIRRHCIIPINKTQTNKLVIAIHDPLDRIALQDLKIASGYDITTVLSSKTNIHNMILKYRSHNISKNIVSFMHEHNPQTSKETENVLSTPVVQLVNSILEQAVYFNASDVHIEPFKDFVRIRFRLDGLLKEMLHIPTSMYTAVINRFKLISGMDILENSSFQDGKYNLDIEGQLANFRMSVLPSQYGEKIVIRTLKSDNFNMNISQLGFTKENFHLFSHILKSTNGIILITGPTGCGKSTTLYTMLKQLNTMDRSIVTVEDPIEYRIQGITQVQVNERLGFETALLPILRQDPDVIMIGEIRNSQTAKIAIRAAITGHLVLSTLHTNDAVTAILRIMDMGIEPLLIATGVVSVIAQRIIRKICPKCKKEYTSPEHEMHILGIFEPMTLVKAEGCEECSYTGYKGRVAIHEILVITKEIRELILHGAFEEIEAKALKSGMKTLNSNAMSLVKQRQTTFDEATRILYNVESDFDEVF